MNYFTSDFFKFFDGLSRHNTKEWFEQHREQYELQVKQPFRKLVEALTDKLARDLPEINRNPAKAVFRIHRDIRFSKDKSPYKVHVAAAFSRSGTKDQAYPGFYIHFGADEIMVGGGKYFCTKEDVARIRQEIYYNHAAFKKLLNEKPFKEKYGTLQGEKNKVLSAEYKEFAVQEPLIANKQFWYYAHLQRSDITGEKLDDRLYSYFKAAYKINAFLWEAIND